MHAHPSASGQRGVLRSYLASHRLCPALRVRATITSHVWVLRRLSGKARGLRILRVWKGRATPPDRMDQRPNRGKYFCANPKCRLFLQTVSMVDFFFGQIKPEFLAMGAGYSGIKYVAKNPDGERKRLRVRHEITGTIGRDDFGASQGAKSPHTGSMEAMTNAGAAQKCPALGGGPSLARGVVAPQSQSPAMLPRRASPRSQIWASHLYRLFRDGP